METSVPYSGSVYDLAKGCWEVEAQPVLAKKKQKTEQAESSLYRTLQETAKELLEAVSTCKGFANRQLQQLIDGMRALIRQIKE